MKKIEYPQLKKIGGFKHLISKVFVKGLVIILVSSALGWFAGHTVQKNFRSAVDFSKNDPVAVEVDADIQEDESGAMRMITGAIDAVMDSDLVQSANRATRQVVYDALKPLIDLFKVMFEFLERVLFWAVFALTFLITGWLTNKVFLILDKRSLTDGTDPQVLKNMEALELKVKELVDRANGE